MKRIIVALFLGVFVLPSIASSATIVVDGMTATDILRLDVSGTNYNVSFEYGNFFDLNVDGNFPFIDTSLAPSAVNAIMDTLNSASPTIPPKVGSSASISATSFLVPHDNVSRSYGSSYTASSLWQWGGSYMSNNTPTMFATFETATVPVPAALWLFGSALGLLGWMRRKAA